MHSACHRPVEVEETGGTWASAAVLPGCLRAALSRRQGLGPSPCPSKAQWKRNFHGCRCTPCCGHVGVYQNKGYHLQTLQLVAFLYIIRNPNKVPEFRKPPCCRPKTEGSGPSPAPLRLNGNVVSIGVLALHAAAVLQAQNVGDCTQHQNAKA